MNRLISFEGGDGSGKTTQIGLLGDYLCAKGMNCIRTREPGATALGKILRQALLEVKGTTVFSATELFLYLADRAQHVHEIIQPALTAGKVVLSDRFSDSTLAYQGYGRGFDLSFLRSLNLIASQGITPYLTFLLDIPPALGLARTHERNTSGAGKTDRFEGEKVEFHEKVRSGFLELARQEPDRFVLLDATLPVTEIHQRIRKIADLKL
ncbi:MAG: dTMP kinase [Candidatus Binatia bacterium]